MYLQFSFSNNTTGKVFKAKGFGVKAKPLNLKTLTEMGTKKQRKQAATMERRITNDARNGAPEVAALRELAELEAEVDELEKKSCLNQGKGGENE